MSPVWAICTLAGSTPSSTKISTCRGPVPLAGREWAMIGAPVRRLARAAARCTFSTFSVTPGSSAAHLMNAALISVSLDALLDVVDEELGDLVRACD